MATSPDKLTAAPVPPIACPHCGKTGQPSRPIADGASVRCPACRQPFTLGGHARRVGPEGAEDPPPSPVSPAMFREIPEAGPMGGYWRTVLFILAALMAAGFGWATLFPWHASPDVYDLILVQATNTRNAILFGSSLVALTILCGRQGRS